VSIALVGFILIQHGKGADAGAGFGGGSSGTVFGSQGSGSFLTRTTAVLATVFFVSNLVLAYFSGQAVTEPTSVTEKLQPATTIESELPNTESDLPSNDMVNVTTTNEKVDIPAE